MKKRYSYETVSEALNDLYKRGYKTDFMLYAEKECIVCKETSRNLSPDDFKIDEVYRFEGMTDPGDEMIVFAISSTSFDMRGTVVDAFGAYSSELPTAIVKKLSKALRE